RPRLPDPADPHGEGRRLHPRSARRGRRADDLDDDERRRRRRLMGVRLRRPSIGAQWALRSAAVMLVTASAFSAYVYERAERGIEKDAKTLIKLQIAQMLEFMEAHPGDVGGWTAFAQRQVGAADPDLRLGISIFDRDGKVVHEAGSAFGAGVELPPRELYGELREVDLGRNYKFLALARGGEEGAV